jgi:hypothetical protein
MQHSEILYQKFQFSVFQYEYLLVYICAEVQSKNIGTELVSQTK